MGGGAWPFLVGEGICLVNCVNQPDLNLLNSNSTCTFGDMGKFLEGHYVSNAREFEALTAL